MLDQMFLLNSILGTGTLLLEIFLVGIILVYIVNYGLLKDIFERAFVHWSNADICLPPVD